MYAGTHRLSVSGRTLAGRSQQQPLLRRASPRATALHRASAERLPAARLWLPAPESCTTAASRPPSRSQCRSRSSAAVSQWKWSAAGDGARSLPRRVQAAASEGDIAYEPYKERYKTPKKVRACGGFQRFCRTAVRWQLVPGAMTPDTAS